MSADRGFSRFRASGVLVLLLAASAIAVLWAAQRASVRAEGDRRRAVQQAGPRVRVAAVQPGGAEATLEFAGEAAPYASSVLYAKSSGFLKDVRVDKGSRVRQGELLAIVESPEVDRDTQALQADADNKQSLAVRMAQLSRQGIVSPRDLEDAEAQARIAREKLASQTVLQGYNRVVAPFAGVVTQRFADPGAMIQNAGASSSAQPLFALAQVGRLRVTFFLDQSVAARVKPGQVLEVHPSDRPDLVKEGRVARVAGALDPRTRTLLVEADLDNGDGAFLAGGAVQVHLRMAAEPGRIDIPTEALVLKGDRSFAAVVAPDGGVKLQALLLGEDNGTRIRVLRGLQAGSRIVLNPPPGLQDGDRVQAVESGS